MFRAVSCARNTNMECCQLGGSITDNGLFTAGTVAGTFVDIVKAFFRADSGELGATLPFTVRPGALSKVLIEPAEIAPDIGTTQPYTFQALDWTTRIPMR